MTVARAVLHVALCGAISTLAALLIRHGRTGRHTGTQQAATTHPPKEHPMAIAADFTISAVDLTEGDLNELRDRLEEAAAAYKADVTVSTHEYTAGQEQQ